MTESDFLHSNIQRSYHAVRRIFFSRHIARHLIGELRIGINQIIIAERLDSIFSVGCISHHMGKKVPVRINSGLTAVLFRLSLGKDLPASGIDRSTPVLGYEKLLPAVIAVVDQFLLVCNGIITSISHHTQEYSHKKIRHCKNLPIPLLPLPALPGSLPVPFFVFFSF